MSDVFRESLLRVIYRQNGIGDVAGFIREATTDAGGEGAEFQVRQALSQLESEGVVRIYSGVREGESEPYSFLLLKDPSDAATERLHSMQVSIEELLDLGTAVDFYTELFAKRNAKQEGRDPGDDSTVRSMVHLRRYLDEQFERASGRGDE